MESLEKIAEKLEAPLLFASGDSYKRLLLIKNLGAVMTSLLRSLIKDLDSITSSHNNEIEKRGGTKKSTCPRVARFDGTGGMGHDARTLARHLGNIEALLLCVAP